MSSQEQQKIEQLSQELHAARVRVLQLEQALHRAQALIAELAGMGPAAPTTPTRKTKR